MDEIDAALDFRNVAIIANYIKERTKNAQFIIISLRNHMLEMADLLVGIYKTHDVSKSVSITPSTFEVNTKVLQPNQEESVAAAGPATIEPAPAPVVVGAASAKGKRKRVPSTEKEH